MITPELVLFERLRGAEAVKQTAPSEGSPIEKEIAPEDRDPVNLRNLFTHQNVHPVVLDLALLKQFGLDWLGWEIPTITAEIKRLFKSVVSELCRSKIQAVKTLHISNGPWKQWQVFEKVIQALNNNIPRADIMQAASIEQLYAGVDMIDSIRRESFDHEVKGYMAAAILNDDILYVPPPLDFVQLEISHPRYECLDCGNEDSALFHDGICDFCTNKFDPENNLSMRPDQEALSKGYGRNLKITLKFDPDPVEKRWREVEHLPTNKIELQDTQEDNQVAKLLMARDYMNIRRRQMTEQLVSLKSWMGTT